jgi:hypothetical protein
MLSCSAVSTTTVKNWYKLFTGVNVTGVNDTGVKDTGEQFIFPRFCLYHSEKNQKSLKFIVSVNDTAKKLFTGVNNTAAKFFGGVNDTGD